MSTCDTYETQASLEDKMKTDGQQRYLKRQSKMTSAATMNEPHKLITTAISKVSKEITTVIETEVLKFDSGGANGRPRAWLELIKDIDPDTLAYIGLNTTFDAVLKFGSQTSTLSKIGRRIELENFALGLYQFDSKLHKRITAQVTKDHTSQVYRIKAARIIAAKEGYKPIKWSSKDCVTAGGPILSAVLKVSDLFTTFDLNFGTTNTKMVIGLTEEARASLFQMETDASWAEPMYGPMIVPPQPWTSFNTGCYYDFALSSSVPLVRGANREQRKAIQHHFEKFGTPDYVKALNAVQATPLKINTDVLSVLEWATENRLDFGKFPEMVAPKFPKTPENIDEMDSEIAMQLKKDQKAWHGKAREADANQGNMYAVLKTANEMSGYDQFWLPWNFDFRGRLYPVSTFNYHRDDHVKSLFTLANGKAVDGDTRDWLSIHLANCGDFEKVSKRSFKDRIDWVANHHDQIMATAQDFKATFDWWRQADKPFQFLAAVYEYAKLENDPDALVCLPPAMDGTNSGVQHYSSAMRNSDDAMLVNLIPSDKCQDVYAAVAEVSTRLLEELKGDPVADAWLAFGVGRKEVKRNTMTYGYSSVERGFCDQILEDLMAPLRRDVAHGRIEKHPFGDNRSQVKHAALLAKVNYQAVQEVVKSVADGMKFLQELTDAVSSEGKTLRWQTPCGFPVIQSYTKLMIKKARIYLWDREAKCERWQQITLRDPNPAKIDTKKMRSAVAANAVHSLDSAHMINTILMALDNDVTDFFMIHDSFATTCADTWTMYHCVRHAFVDQYEGGCFFEEIRSQVAQRVSDPNKVLPPVPPKGALDIRGVLESEYCFS